MERKIWEVFVVEERGEAYLLTKAGSKSGKCRESGIQFIGVFEVISLHGI